MFPYGYFNIKFEISVLKTRLNACAVRPLACRSRFSPQRKNQIHCDLLWTTRRRSHRRQGKGLRDMLSRHTFLHTISDCNTSQNYSKGPGRVREQRTRDDRRVFDDSPWLVVPSPREI